MLGSPVACHHKNRLCPSGICDIDIEVSITDDVGLREVNSEVLLRAEQHSWTRLATIASSVGMMRAKVDGVQLRAVTSQFGRKDVVNFVDERFGKVPPLDARLVGNQNRLHAALVNLSDCGTRP